MSEGVQTGKMGSRKIVCWKCGAELVELILPLSRREECPLCAADQHVCKLCQNFDSLVAGQCREDRAEEVTDKERANFCDYFKPQLNAFKEKTVSENTEARAKLANLFGEDSAEEASLVAGDKPQLTEEERARAELDRLFGNDD